MGGFSDAALRCGTLGKNFWNDSSEAVTFCNEGLLNELLSGEEDSAYTCYLKEDKRLLLISDKDFKIHILRS